DKQMRLDLWDQESRFFAPLCDFSDLIGKTSFQTPTPEKPVFSAHQCEISEMEKRICEAKTTNTAPAQPEITISTIQENKSGNIVHQNQSFRFSECPTLEYELNDLKQNNAAFDVLVIGGGTAGASATIAAARQNAKTLCIENLNVLGGVSTAGRIGNYWYGNRVGFTEEMDQGILKMGHLPEEHKHTPKNTYKEWKPAWLLQTADNAGADILFNSMVIAAITKNENQVCGSLVASPYGIATFTANTVIDATGNADLVAAAGGECFPLVDKEPVIQGAGLPENKLTSNYSNSDYQFICDSDVLDATLAFTFAHKKFENDFDIASILDTRERRRIIGDIILQPQDFFSHREYEDTIVIATSNFDTHGSIVHPMFLLKHTEETPYFANVPFRALLPRNLTGILATGLAVSAHRDCLPLIRMQPDVQNQGYAAGLAAALALNSVGNYRTIDIRALQKLLIKHQILPQSILQQIDAPGKIAEDDTHFELASIFLHPEESRQRLHVQYEEKADLKTAHILAFLGDDIGRALLTQKIADTPWDDGWNYRGMGQFGPCVSPLDSIILAWTNVGGERGLMPVKLPGLHFTSEFSHIRVVCLSFIAHPEIDAVPELSRLLEESGPCRAVINMKDVLQYKDKERNDTTIRNDQLKQLYLAKALHACKPDDVMAQKILDAYAKSKMAYFAIFAQK
ncbi:MAG: FAD-dependent oxidoreductase, partial [Lentisphaeria bacterium]